MKKRAMLLVIALLIALSVCVSLFGGETRKLYLPVEECYYSGSGRLSKRSVYVYDENDFLIEIKNYRYSNGEEYLYTTDTITCDENGNIISWIIPSGEDAWEPKTSCYQYGYNKRGQLVKRSLYTSVEDVEPRFEETWSYDNEGKLVTYTKENKDWIDMSCSYQYDGAKRIKMVQFFRNKELFSQTECIYNKSGQMIQQLNYLTDGTLYGRWDYSYEGKNRIRKIAKDAESYNQEMEMYSRIFDTMGNLVSDLRASGKPNMECTFREIKVPADSLRNYTMPQAIGILQVEGYFSGKAF